MATGAVMQADPFLAPIGAAADFLSVSPDRDMECQKVNSVNGEAVDVQPAKAAT